jgi:hypothetical protein
MNVSAALATCDLNCNAITSIPSGHLQCVSDVRFGSEAAICAATSHVRFTPNSDRKSRHAKADMAYCLSAVGWKKGIWP